MHETLHETLHRRFSSRSESLGGSLGRVIALGSGRVTRVGSIVKGKNGLFREVTQNQISDPIRIRKFKIGPKIGSKFGFVLKAKKNNPKFGPDFSIFRAEKSKFLAGHESERPKSEIWPKIDPRFGRNLPITSLFLSQGPWERKGFFFVIPFIVITQVIQGNVTERKVFYES